MHTMLSVLQEPMQQEEFTTIYHSRYAIVNYRIYFIYYFHFL